MLDKRTKTLDLAEMSLNELHNGYWKEFSKYLSNKQVPFPKVNGEGKHYRFSVGDNVMVSGSILSREKKIRVELIITQAVGELEIYNNLNENMEEIHSELGAELTWKPARGQKRSHITLLYDANPRNLNNRKKQFEWLELWLSKFYEVFNPRVRTEPKISIEEIYIENFRSIRELKLKCADITTFIGSNDTGKSNIIKALNLFFNKQTEQGQGFDAQKDLCRFHKVLQNKAEEIIIRITFSVSNTYKTEGKGKDAKKIIWQKVWRKSGFFDDPKRSYTRLENNKELPRNSRIRTLLDRIIFKYIPAIRDKAFFADMQGQLYETLASTKEKELRNSAKGFESSIQKQTIELLYNLGVEFNAKTMLSLPENLRKIFEDLEFYSDDMPLSLRGDGIKSRHIPMILNFMLEKKNAMPGESIPHTHIWGFEEPENCVEMRAAFDFLNKFTGTAANGVRIFFTTHSPIFYKIEHNGITTKNYSVKKKEIEVRQKKEIAKGYGTYIFDADNISKLDESMGLMPLVKPYIELEKKNAEELQKKYEQIEQKLQNINKPALFLEGHSDKTVFIRAIKLWHGDDTIEKIAVYPDEGDNSCADYVRDQIIAWNHVQKHKSDNQRKKAFSIFDADEKGKAAHKDASKYSNSGITKSKILKNSSKFGIFENGFKIDIDLEFLYSHAMWEIAERQGWLKKRKNLERVLPSENFDDLFRHNKSLEDVLSVLSNEERRIINYSWTQDGKKKASKYIANLNNKEAEEALGEFKGLVADIMSYLLNSK